ncbi:MAG: succinylglutamate desuccinylase/aspartoacylase family protein [Oligoflexia bacterium]|nr:succinylglutamate desuccinylase/aspartoacylase family protein [Oligoflexia bacterium]
MKNFFLLFTVLFCFYSASAHSTIHEFYFEITLPTTYCPTNYEMRIQLKEIERFASIDVIEGEHLYVYVSARKRDALLDYLNSDPDLTYEELVPPSWREDPLITDKLNDLKFYALIGNWSRYPTYNNYVAFLDSMAKQYPQIASLIEMGKSVNGHQLLLLKIAANPNTSSIRPKFILSGAIHGDELVGSMILLQLIEYLLTNYSSNQRVRTLVDNLEIWINPIFNPDGSYAQGDDTVKGATRYNANGVDLNRNLPDPSAGEHPDGESWQKETVAFKKLLIEQKFIFAVDFHGGAELINYPWDTFQRLHADDNWYQSISRLYADAAQQSAGHNGYMTGGNNGIINGYAWYEVNGGRQDYFNYFEHTRAVTAEVSKTKIPHTTMLTTYFKYNLASILLLLEQVPRGVWGTVTDVRDASGIMASVEILNHDRDNSFIFSNLELNNFKQGGFYRPLIAGEYQFKISAPGYTPQIRQLPIPLPLPTRLDVQLTPVTPVDH